MGENVLLVENPFPVELLLNTWVLSTPCWNIVDALYPWVLHLGINYLQIISI
jgi:hypothetical protein